MICDGVTLMMYNVNHSIMGFLPSQVCDGMDESIEDVAQIRTCFPSTFTAVVVLAQMQGHLVDNPCRRPFNSAV
jgi:hypothetical protein